MNASQEESDMDPFLRAISEESNWKQIYQMDLNGIKLDTSKNYYIWVKLNASEDEKDFYEFSAISHRSNWGQIYQMHCQKQRFSITQIKSDNISAGNATRKFGANV